MLVYRVPLRQGSVNAWIEVDTLQTHSRDSIRITMNIHIQARKVILCLLPTHNVTI